ncbi:hypothetical protein MVEG_00276 [Podila verticillata NRRL 6337]|nr:hypothetical protein MVEG_00276 [Podila verticillata NRRL 6337]
MATPLPPSYTIPLTSTETRRPRQILFQNKPQPLFDEKVTLTNWYKFVDWDRAPSLIIGHSLLVYGLLTVEMQKKTMLWTFFCFVIISLGVTAGYHRLWSHRSYTAIPAMELTLAILGGASFQGSILWWCEHHRAHHRWTDTDKDPYSAHRGLFYSHIGWALVKRPKGSIGPADVQDLTSNRLVMWQHKYYLPLSVLVGFVFPIAVAGFGWGDWPGAFFFAGLLRMVADIQAAFCVNSVAHWLGDAPYDDKLSPRDSFLTALVTAGEGYHNFHHQFPSDYRNGVKFWQYDPSKWLIASAEYFGFASHLKRFPENEIRKAELQMIEQRVLEKKKKLVWGTPITELPVMSFQDFEDACKNNAKKWILLEGVVYTVENFEHPGGERFMKMAVGKDMTTAFNGGIYDHSNAARNLLSLKRVAVVEFGGEVEAMKKNPSVPVYGGHCKDE